MTQLNGAQSPINDACQSGNPTPSDNSPLKLDFEMMNTHIAAIGAANEPINIRFIHEQRKDLPVIKRRGTVEQHRPEIEKRNRDGYGVFITIAVMDGTGYDANGYPIKDMSGDKKENVAAIRAHYADLDKPSAPEDLQRASKHNPPPQFCVNTSPGRFHVYTTLATRYCDNAQFKTDQQRYAQVYNGDPQVTDATRVLRLAGTYHRKTDVPHLVTIHSLPGWDKLADPKALSASLAHTDLIQHSTGVRKPLGDRELAAPSLALALMALEIANPNKMMREEWIKFTAAFKQAIWRHTTEDVAFTYWFNWCSGYKTDTHTNDPADNYKQWKSLKETEVGWKYIEDNFSQIKAQRMFGGAEAQHSAKLPMPEANSVAQDISFLNEVNEATFGKPISSEAFKIMRNSKLNVGFNDFKQCISVTGKLPWDASSHVKFPRDWTPVDQSGLRMAVQQFPGMARIAKDQVEEALVTYVDRRRFNPVTDYLNALHHDGKPRLNNLLTHYFSAENIEFATLVGPKFLIGMVARAMRPGCKRDEVLILEGNQGTLKSTALNVLAGGDEYFADHLPDVNSKDAIIQLHGNWLIEIGELSALRKSEAEDIKRFIVSRTDKYRPPFGRVSIEVPRTSVMAGTTNAETYLKDPTGARRFWPVRCGSIDLDGLRRDRDQLFAEAVARFKNGERWWLEGDAEVGVAAQQTEERQERDEWHDDIAAYLTRIELCGGTVSMRGIMEDGLRITDPNMKKRGTTGRIAAILRAEGYSRKRENPDKGGKRSWFYLK